MKNSTQSISLILAAALVGVAAFSFASSSFNASLPGDVFVAVVASAAIVGFAAYDYSRRTQPLRLPVRLLRPPMPARTASRNPAKSNRNDQLAA